MAYIDDGRTVADMSAVPGGLFSRKRGSSTGSFRDKWNTYWAATRMMLLPLLVFCLGIGVVYAVILAIFYLL